MSDHRLGVFLDTLGVGDKKTRILELFDGTVGELAIDDFVALGIDEDVAGNILSFFRGLSTPIREWTAESVCAFVARLSFLKEPQLSIALKNIAEKHIVGATLVVLNNDALVALLGVDNEGADALRMEVLSFADATVDTKMHTTREMDSAVVDEYDDDEKKEDGTGVTEVKKRIIPLPQVAGSERATIGEWKTILVVGETGTGKSTTLNSMVNYLFGVKYSDTFRYKLVFDDPKADQSQSVTEKVTEYHIAPQRAGIDYGLVIVDTPGFGDTRGMAQDKIVMKQIEDCFRKRVTEVNAVCFTIRAGCSRLTPAQEYVYGSILGLFGKDIAKNLFVLITFCDGKTPPAMAALKKQKISYVKCIRLNNSAFFNGFEDMDDDARVIGSVDSSTDGDDDDDDVDLSLQFWDMGMKAFARFFKYVTRVPTTTLALTKEVLKERNLLELSVHNINKDIRKGLDTITSLRQTMAVVKQHQTDFDANSEFIVTVPVPAIKKVDISGSCRYTTTCLGCSFTCHYGCAIPNDSEKAGCIAMRGGNCTQCPLHCHWSAHSNVPYIFEHGFKNTPQVLLPKKKAAEAAAKGMSNTEAVLRHLRDRFIQTRVEVTANIEIVRKALERLTEIALRPMSLKTDDFFEQMVVAEETKAEYGYQQRVRAIREIQQEQRQLREIREDGGVKKFGEMSEDLKQLDKDIRKVSKSVRKAHKKMVESDDSKKTAAEFKKDPDSGPRSGAVSSLMMMLGLR